MKNRNIGYGAFSSLEMGLSILLIIIITSVLMYYFNPSKGIYLKRNKQRNDDVALILNSVSRYISDNGNVIPNSIPIGGDCNHKRAQICKTGAPDCTELVDMKEYGDTGVYLQSIPVDPSSKSVNGTGYNIVQNESGLITVCAPLAELGEKISLSK